MLAKMCTYVELTRGPLTLVDVAMMNDILDVKEENEAPGKNGSGGRALRYHDRSPEEQRRITEVTVKTRLMRQTIARRRAFLDRERELLARGIIVKVED